MILAAGLGTRLGPLTAEMPKALISVGSVPAIERVARRLIAAGVDRLIINTHHFAEQIVDFVRERSGFGVDVAFSNEPGRPLETGGGLKAAAPLLRRDQPFFLHNADVISDIPLERMYAAHLAGDAIATLAVMSRTSTRQLLFDEGGLLGRLDSGKGVRVEGRRMKGRVIERAFAGIHVISPDFLDRMSEEGAFSILDSYLRVIGEGRRIDAFDADGYSWIDIGRPEQLAKAERMLGEQAGERG